MLCLPACAASGNHRRSAASAPLLDTLGFMHKMRAPKEDLLASILSHPPRKEAGVWERFQPNRDMLRQRASQQP